eukprot:TRINITY_DN10982_c0_g1_i1.p1 TRINITY_DN10982_c0_g1~~TRINITY_DN10982_c0_g1_i1.p1  ORF type:complete len:392 (+),score=118.60 TRINITY_DN10982_c0_g1_i1:59-1234(+)
MKVVLCSNAFKECLSAKDASEAMAAGVRAAAPDAQCIVVPLADGGDSTLEVLVEQRGGEYRTVRARDPLFREIEATYGLIDGGSTAVIEMAKVSGLALLTDAERDPTKTSTVGTGDLIRDAAERGVSRVILCIGGSATNDGGIGVAHALGYRFLDAGGVELPPVGGSLGRIRRIDSSKRDPRLRGIRVTVACDVTNPLCGPTGATAVYGPQKGAKTEEMREGLDSGLRNLAGLWVTQLGAAPDLAERPGAGAAGGLGGGSIAFLGAEFRSGFALVAELSLLRTHLRGAVLAITGEGRIDEQTGSGKVPHGVAVQCREAGVPLAGIFGGVKNPEKIREVPLLGDAAIFSLCNGPMSLRDAMVPANAKRLIREQAFMVTRLFLIGRKTGVARL